jgi:hypothetical protein
MTPREVVTRAIEFKRPPRLPIRGHGEASDVIGDYGDHTVIGASPETRQFMLDEFRRLDPWAHGW